MVQVVEHLCSFELDELSGGLVDSALGFICGPSRGEEAQELGPVQRKAACELQLAAVDLD